tara:strand:- start:454 stop:630 length:177 start_codon:yes stop_codon:yes gene_type:complete
LLQVVVEMGETDQVVVAVVELDYWDVKLLDLPLYLLQLVVVEMVVMVRKQFLQIQQIL